MYKVDHDIERLKKLNLGEHKDGFVIFCPECDFQGEPNAAFKPKCPECGYAHMHVITIDEELLEIAKKK